VLPLCCSVRLALPHPRVPDKLTESDRWLGDRFILALHDLGVVAARRIEVPEARADIASLKSRPDAVAQLLLQTCYGALSPHEVAIGDAKLVGFAQVRRRHAALFQVGVLLRDQSPLADSLRVPNEATRDVLRTALRQRTTGL